MLDPTRLAIPIHFAVLEDPRSDHTKRHPLLDIITIALCAVLSGADSWYVRSSPGERRDRRGGWRGAAQDARANQLTVRAKSVDDEDALAEPVEVKRIVVKRQGDV